MHLLECMTQEKVTLQITLFASLKYESQMTWNG
jgi:hypothetical protein